MTRVKRGVGALKRRKKVLSQTKGFRFGRSTKEREAKTALLHSGSSSFAHRKDKKSDRRGLWQTKINAGLYGQKLSFSRLMDGLKKKGVTIDRKILADLAENNKRTFDTIVKEVA